MGTEVKKERLFRHMYILKHREKNYRELGRSTLERTTPYCLIKTIRCKPTLYLLVRMRRPS